MKPRKIKKPKSQEQQVAEIWEVVHFMKDTAVTQKEFYIHTKDMYEFKQDMHLFRQEMYVFRKQTDAKFKELANQVITHVDGFVKLHQHLETEFAAIQLKYSRLEEQVAKILKHLALEPAQ